MKISWQLNRKTGIREDTSKQNLKSSLFIGIELFNLNVDDLNYVTRGVNSLRHVHLSDHVLHIHDPLDQLARFLIASSIFFNWKQASRDIRRCSSNWRRFHKVSWNCVDNKLNFVRVSVVHLLMSMHRTAPGDTRYTRPGTTTVLGDSCRRAPAAGPALEEEPDLPPLCWRARTTPCCR